MKTIYNTPFPKPIMLLFIFVKACGLLESNDITEILLKVALNTINQPSQNPHGHELFILNLLGSTAFENVTYLHLYYKVLDQFFRIEKKTKHGFYFKIFIFVTYRPISKFEYCYVAITTSKFWISNRKLLNEYNCFN